MKYDPNESIPDNDAALRAWIIDEIRRIGYAVNDLEPNTVVLPQWNAAPDKLYNGLTAYADGTNWDPGSGEGVYTYYNSTWNKLG